MNVIEYIFIHRQREARTPKASERLELTNLKFKFSQKQPNIDRWLLIINRHSVYNLKMLQFFHQTSTQTRTILANSTSVSNWKCTLIMLLPIRTRIATPSPFYSWKSASFFFLIKTYTAVPVKCDIEIIGTLKSFSSSSMF